MRKRVINYSVTRAALDALRATGEHAEHETETRFRKARAGLIAEYDYLFRQLNAGKIDYFFFYSGKLLTSFTRSIKETGKIQRTTFLIRENEYIPLSDGTYTTAKECDRRDGLKDRVSIFIKETRKS